MEKSKKKMEKNKKQTGQVFLSPPLFFLFQARVGCLCCFPVLGFVVCLFVCFFFEFNGAIISMYLQIIGSK